MAEHLHVGPTPKRIGQMKADVAATRMALVTKLGRAVTTGVWGERRTAWNTVVAFCVANGLPLPSWEKLPEDPTILVLAVEALGCSDGTKAKYLSALKALYVELGHGVPALLASTLRVTRKLGGLTTPTQALPIDRHQVALLMSTAPSPWLRLAFWLAYKTASRWGEIFLLTRASFLVATPSELVISWTAERDETETPGTKSAHRAGGKYATRFYTQVLDVEPMEWQATLLNSVTRGGKKKLFPWTTAMIDVILKQIPLSEYQQELVRYHGKRTHLSAHSFKMGADEVMLQAIVDGRLDKAAKAVMLKHKAFADMETPEVSVRYGAHNPNQGRINGTGRATRLLIVEQTAPRSMTS
jgi:hypothetical protein